MKAAPNGKETFGNKATVANVVFEEPDNKPGNTDNEMNYEEIEDYDATYTALDRNSKEDKDHFYCHLKDMRQIKNGNYDFLNVDLIGKKL